MGRQDESLTGNQYDSDEAKDELDWLDDLDSEVPAKDEDAVGNEKSTEDEDLIAEPGLTDETMETMIVTSEAAVAPDSEPSSSSGSDSEPDEDQDVTLVEAAAPEIADEDLPDWLRDQEPDEQPQEDESASEDELGWLDKVAAGEGAVMEEPPTMSWDDEEDASDDPEQAMAWLDKLAAQQGASTDELEPVDEGPSPEQEPPDTEEVDAESEDAEGGFERFADEVESEFRRLVPEEQDEYQGPQAEYEADFSEIPEDPDEAMAWLERLAARQGALSEELTSISPEVEKAARMETAERDASLPAPEKLDESAEVEEVDLPADDDEALAWLEELAIDEFGGWDKGTDSEMVEEPITPVRPLDVKTAKREVETLFPEPDSQPWSEIEEPVPAPEEVDTAPLIDPLAMESKDGPEEGFTESEVLAPSDDDIEPPDWLVDDVEMFVDTGADLAEESEILLEELAAAEDEEEPETLELAGGLLEEELVDEPILDEGIEELEKEAVEQVVMEVAQPAIEPPVADIDEERTEEEIPLAEPVEVELAIAEEDVEEEISPEVIEEDVTEASEVEEQVEEPDLVEEISEEPLEATEVEPETAEEAIEEPVIAAADDEGELFEEDEGEMAWASVSAEIDTEAWLESEMTLASDVTSEIEIAEELTPDVLSDSGFEEEAIIEHEIEATALDTEIGVKEQLQPDQQKLDSARAAVASGEIDDAVQSYTALVQEGQGIAYLIADLELAIDDIGPRIPLQRVLGDAYVRNGQLAKALRTYREALDQL